MKEVKIKVNPEQKKAIEFSTGQLLVVAGAGTGKTRVITQRIKHLIEKKGVGPNELLALTFTDKASGEMLERVGDIMPLGYEEPWIYTFHSFADRILKNEGLEIGFDPGYKILSGSDQWVFFRKYLFDFDLDYFRPLGNPTKFISAILKFVSRAQDEDVAPEDVFKYAKQLHDDKEKSRWLELARVYKKYEEVKLAQSKVDFGNLMTWLLKLFRERPNILLKYQSQFKHILVDEFQDTNYAQYELIKMLSFENMGNRSLLVVGDDSQSIYKFRGAAVSNILGFIKDYPSSKMISLTKNYRSTQEILDPAYKLISNNNPDTLESKLGVSKKLESRVLSDSIFPEVIEIENIESEVEYVVSRILEILAKETSYMYKDFAILARANNHLDPFVTALRKNNIPYQLIGNRGLYDRDEVKDILSFLKVLVNPLDEMSLYRILNIPTLEINKDVISQILSNARSKKINIWEVVSNTNDEKVTSLNGKVKEFQGKITKFSPSEIVYKIVFSLNYLSLFLKDETVDNQLCIKNLDLFLNIVKQFEANFRAENKETPLLIHFVDYIDILIEAGDNPAQAEIEDVDTVNLMTVHASKGLEFPVVFMINLVSDRFPTRDRGDAIELPNELIKEVLPAGDAHLQEERRLFYVGMTRAKKYLYLVFAKNYGGKRDKVPSGFVRETGLKVKSVKINRLVKPSRQTDIFGIESDFRTKGIKTVPDFLSYTQVSAYEICPLRYKYGYILKIPTAPSHALSFGISMHDTLRDFHSELIFNQNISLKRLFALYEKNWQPLGYLDENHRKLRYESGRKLLERYWKENKGLITKPLALEKAFNIRIDGIRFYGKIDQIDPLLDGGVEIIDYKTGNPKTQKEVDQDDQVSYYAMGAKEGLGYEPKKLTLYYIEAGEKYSTVRSQKQLNERKEKVKEVINGIKSGHFKATPGMHCNWCDYKDICPYAWRG